jgi:hypothetical protein
MIADDSLNALSIDFRAFFSSGSPAHRVWISVLALFVSSWSAFLSWQSGRRAKRALAENGDEDLKLIPMSVLYFIAPAMPLTK